MTQEDKKLLLQDLCMRLPYGVKIKFNDGTNNAYNLDGNINGKFTENVLLAIDDLELKPYLRPMSSMTEEEKEEIRQQFCYEWEKIVEELMYYSIEISDADRLIDWFNEHYFDYRGLIAKGLALEAPEYMYNNNKEK